MLYLHLFFNRNRCASLFQPSKMSKRKRAEGKAAPAPADMKKQEAKEVVNLMFEKRPKNLGIRGGIRPRRDLTHLVKWTTPPGCSSKGLFSINI